MALEILVTVSSPDEKFNNCALAIVLCKTQPECKHANDSGSGGCPRRLLKITCSENWLILIVILQEKILSDSLLNRCMIANGWKLKLKCTLK